MLSFKQMLPKSSSDRFGCIFGLFGIHAIFLYEVFYILPWIESQNEGYSVFMWYFHVTNACILYVNTMGCFWKVISTETGTAGIMLPSILKPEWRYCHVCESNSPPRSFHCYSCKRCILRRDHHCVFTGNCIGVNNHRFFLMLLFNAWVAATYATIMNLDYMWATVGGFSVWSIFKLIFPFVSWVFGAIGFIAMLTAALNLLCVAATLTIAALLGYHLRNLYFGQLTHERTHRVVKYSIGWKENVRAIFGDRWTVAWLFPWIPSPLPGNGLEFPIASKYENPKDL